MSFPRGKTHSCQCWLSSLRWDGPGLKPNSERGDALGQPPSVSQLELMLSKAEPRLREGTGHPLDATGMLSRVALGVITV